MPSPVIAAPRARLHIIVVVDYLNARNPAAARRFLERLKAAYRQLADFPLSGARGRLPDTRRLVMAPYILTYRVDLAGVEVVDIRHGRQRAAPAAEDAL